MSHLLGYARVSTAGQDPQLQLDALNGAGCYLVRVDVASGKTAARPELTRVLEELRPGDTLVVWRLDRLGRSVVDLLAIVEQLRGRDVAFRSLTEGLDTSTATGRFTLHILAALAEMERELIRERTHAGLAAARAGGRVFGRPPKLSPQQVKQAQRLHADGVSLRTIGARFGISHSTVAAALHRARASSTVSTSITAKNGSGE